MLPALIACRPVTFVNVIIVQLTTSYHTCNERMHSFCCSDEVQLASLLHELLVKNLPIDRSCNQRIAVRRKHLCADAMNRFRTGIDEHKYLKVTFVGEPAVDDGGPLREFFHILMTSLSENNNLFCGPGDSRTPRKNVIEFQKKSFYQVGKMIAMSLVHGGPAPHFFSPPVADYICFGLLKIRASISDVQEADVRQALNEVLFYITVYNYGYYSVLCTIFTSNLCLYYMLLH